MKYEAVIFDVSDTLVEYSPNYAQIFGARLRDLGYFITDEKAAEISRAVNLAICEQTQLEQEGESHLSEEEYNKLMDSAALSCVTSDDLVIKKDIKKLENRY